MQIADPAFGQPHRFVDAMLQQLAFRHLAGPLAHRQHGVQPQVAQAQPAVQGLQFGRAFAHQFLQVLAVLLQLEFGPLLISDVLQRAHQVVDAPVAAAVGESTQLGPLAAPRGGADHLDLDVEGFAGLHGLRQPRDDLFTRTRRIGVQCGFQVGPVIQRPLDDGVNAISPHHGVLPRIGTPATQATDGLALAQEKLALSQTSFGQAALGHVLPDAQHARRHPAGIQDHPVGPAQQQAAPGAGDRLELDVGHGCRVGHDLGDHVRQVAARRGLDQRHDAAHRLAAQQFTEFVAKQALGKLVEVADRAVRPEAQDDHVGMGHQLAVIRLAQTDGLFGDLALGNVRRRADRQQRRAVGQPLNDRADGVQPDMVAVGVAKPVLRFEDRRAGGAHRLLHAGLELGQIVGVDAPHPRAQRVQHVVGPQPQDGQHAPIEGQAAGSEVELPVHDLGHVDRQLQALFGALAPGQVMADAEHADRAAIAREDGDLGGLHQFAMAVIRERDPLLVLDGYALGDGRAVAGAEILGSCGIEEVACGAAEDGLLGGSDEPLEAGVAGQVAALRVLQPDGVGQGRQQGAQEAAFLAQIGQLALDRGAAPAVLLQSGQLLGEEGDRLAQVGCQGLEEPGPRHRHTA